MIEESFHGVVVLTGLCWSVNRSIHIRVKELNDRISYTRKEYEFVVQRMSLLGLSWAGFGYRKDRAP